MRKIAIRLGLLVFTMILGVLFFIWYRSIQAPGLLSLLPNDVKAAAFIDTRNIVKKAFKSGANELVGIEFPEMLVGLFTIAEYAKEPGINVYSELVWFEHNEGFNCLMARLSSPDKWEEFLVKNKEKANLGDIEKMDEVSYVRLNNFNAVIAWRGKLLAILYDNPSGETLSISQANWVLSPDSYNNILNTAFEKIAPDVFYVNIEDNMTVSLKILSGKIRYEINQYKNSISELSPFYSLKSTETFFSDTTRILMSAQFIQTQKNLLEQYPELSVLSAFGFTNNKVGAELCFYKQSDSSQANIRVQPFLNGLEFPSGFEVENPSETLLLADISSKTVQDLNIQVLPKHLPPFRRFVMLVESNEVRVRTSGTCYFEDKEKLPLREVAEYLINLDVIKIKF